mgnify:CR=1 FL=1
MGCSASNINKVIVSPAASLDDSEEADIINQTSHHSISLLREELNLFLLRQMYLVKKLQQGQRNKLGELKTVNLLIEKWYLKESEKVQHQSCIREFQESEKSSIYHHELHKKIIRKSSILKLQCKHKRLDDKTLQTAAYHFLLVDEMGGLHHEVHELIGVGAPVVEVLQRVLHLAEVYNSFQSVRLGSYGPRYNLSEKE